MDAIKYIVFHHSGVDVDSSAASIADYHVNTLGWSGIGYHFRIGWTGQVEYVGDITTSRANVYGRNNEVLGICIPGNWVDRWPPDAALLSARQLLRYLRLILPGREVVGHGQIALASSPTSCPGPLWPNWRSSLRDAYEGL